MLAAVDDYTPQACGCFVYGYYVNNGYHGLIGSRLTNKLVNFRIIMTDGIVTQDIQVFVVLAHLITGQTGITVQSYICFLGVEYFIMNFSIWVTALMMTD